MYLMISNPGVCPSEGFTLFGASTHRFQDELIGEFGSGNKMAINLLMRNRLFPVVFCGNLKLEFGLKKINMSETNFNQVTVKYSGRTEDGNTKNTTRDLDHVVDYGVKDWNAIELALREFISNALDSARSINNYEFWNKIEVKIVQDNQVRAKTGYTRVFVPLYDSYGTVNTNVANFINNTNKWFLHFKESHLLNAKVLYKNNRSINDNSVVIFKKGVRVAEWLTNMSSLFDYNINDIPLNESRCVERYTANAYAIRCFYYFSTPNDIKLLFNSLKNYNETIFEHQFDFNSYVNSRSSERDEEFKKCFYNVFGQNSIIVDNNRFFQSLTSKGFNPVVLPYHYYEFLSKVGVKTYLQVLSSNEISGIELYEPSENFNNLFIKIWNSMENLKLTNSKEIPTLKIFNQVMDFGSIRMGFYKDNTVYINQSLVSDKPCLELIMTLLEEIGHYVTGACDESRDFQDYFIRLAASLIFSND